VKHESLKKPAIILPAIAGFVFLMLIASAYFMPYLFISASDEDSVMASIEPNWYTLPIIVRMAEHGIINGGGYSKSSRAPEWASLIAGVRDRRSVACLRKLSAHPDAYISRNAMAALIAMGEMEVKESGK